MEDDDLNDSLPFIKLATAMANVMHFLTKERQNAQQQRNRHCEDAKNEEARQNSQREYVEENLPDL